MSISTGIVEHADLRTNLIREEESVKVSAVKEKIPILREVETLSGTYVYMA